MPLILGPATADDLPALKALMMRSIAELQGDFLSPKEIEASFELMGLDSQLVADGTYCIVRDGDAIAGCGGWSRRATLFGGDHTAGRDAALLDPKFDAARIRAMYTDPAFVRRGVGRMILAACEAAAAAEGFLRCEMAATLAGEPLYRSCGYEVIELFFGTTVGGVQVPLKRMGKSLGPPL